VEQHAGFTLRDIAHVLFKRKWVILIFLVTTVGVASALALIADRPMYEATAQLMLRPGRLQLSDPTLPTAGQSRPPVGYRVDEQAASTIAMLMGPYLSEQLVATVGARRLCYEPAVVVPLLGARFCDPALDERTLAYRVTGLVHSSVHAERVGDAALINLSFQHSDPNIAAKGANQLGALYVERHLSVLQNPRTEAFIQEQLALLRDRTTRAEQAIEDFKARYGLTSSAKEEHEIALQRLSALERDYQTSLSQAAEVGSRLAQLNAEADSRGALYQQEERVRNQVELEAQRGRVAAQERQLATLRSKVETLGRITPEFERLEQRLEMERQNYGAYVARSEEARVAQAMDAEKIASVRIIDFARPPMQPLPSKLRLMILVAILFGAVGGVVLAFALDLISDRLETAERTEAILGAPVLTSLPGTFSSRERKALPPASLRGAS
jgi:uncharacterized protein involved in exopolysaccharide biosynthesis